MTIRDTAELEQWKTRRRSAVEARRQMFSVSYLRSASRLYPRVLWVLQNDVTEQQWEAELRMRASVAARYKRLERLSM